MVKFITFPKDVEANLMVIQKGKKGLIMVTVMCIVLMTLQYVKSYW